MGVLCNSGIAVSRRAAALSLVMLILIGTATSPAQAQQADQQFYILEQENIDMSLTGRYEKGLYAAITAMHRAKLGPEFNWQASQHGSTYFFISKVPASPEQQPSRSDRLATAIDKQSHNQFSSMTKAVIRSRLWSVLEPAPRLSYEPLKPIVQPKLNYVDIVQVHAARVEQFFEATTRTIAGLKDAGYAIGFTTYRVVQGNPNPDAGPSYYLVSPYNTRSQFYQEHPLVGALQKALGKDEATRLLLGQRQNLISGQSFDHARRPDLSYQARIKN